MLTTRDAAARLGLTPQSVARLCKQGQIKAARIGRDYLISETELARFAALKRPGHRPKRKDKTMQTIGPVVIQPNLAAAKIVAQQRSNEFYARADRAGLRGGTGTHDEIAAGWYAASVFGDNVYIVTQRAPGDPPAPYRVFVLFGTAYLDTLYRDR